MLRINREKYLVVAIIQVYGYKDVDIEEENLRNIMNEVLGGA
jgi:hypothetical protein